MNVCASVEIWMCPYPHLVYISIHPLLTPHLHIHYLHLKCVRAVCTSNALSSCIWWMQLCCINSHFPTWWVRWSVFVSSVCGRAFFTNKPFYACCVTVQHDTHNPCKHGHFNMHMYVICNVANGLDINYNKLHQIHFVKHELQHHLLYLHNCKNLLFSKCLCFLDSNLWLYPLKYSAKERKNKEECCFSKQPIYIS